MNFRIGIWISTMMHWLKHAFAIETSPVVPSESQKTQIDLVCHEIVRRQMTLPAQMLLESSLPLNFLAGQMLRFMEPFLGALLDPAAVRDFAAFVERPGAVDYICDRLNHFQNEQSSTPSRESSLSDHQP